MKIYVTKSGDMWDMIAYTQMGSTSHADALIHANLQHKDIYIFPSGVELSIPEVKAKVSSLLPPWKRNSV